VEEHCQLSFFEMGISLVSGSMMHRTCVLVHSLEVHSLHLLEEHCHPTSWNV
jgi:hypothetical protein